MKILLTGATGYIGSKLFPALAQEGHEVICLARDKARIKHTASQVTILEGDLLKPESLSQLPSDLEAAYYLVHSMGDKPSGFSELETRCAQNFVDAIKKTQIKQIIYLSGLSQTKSVSEHMTSRHRVEDILRASQIPLTVLRAGIIIGKGSLSFKIIHDLVKKLPAMIAPKWVFSRCQPIAISDVLFYFKNVLNKRECFEQTFEIGGPDILTYRDMLIRFAQTQGWKRWVIPVPVLTPYLSSLWLVFITSANFSIARALVSSLKTDAVCKDKKIHEILPHICLGYEDAIKKALAEE